MTAIGLRCSLTGLGGRVRKWLPGAVSLAGAAGAMPLPTVSAAAEAKNLRREQRTSRFSISSALYPSFYVKDTMPEGLPPHFSTNQTANRFPIRKRTRPALAVVNNCSGVGAERLENCGGQV